MGVWSSGKMSDSKPEDRGSIPLTPAKLFKIKLRMTFMSKHISDEEYRNIYLNDYVKNNMTIIEIGKKYHKRKDTVSKEFRRLLLPIKSTPEYELKFPPFDIYAFDKWSIEMAYWLGFIVADGSVREKNNVLQIGLNSIDKEHLIKFSKFINLNKQPIDYSVINTVTNKPSKASRISVNSFYMINRLKSLGVKPNKSNQDINFLSYIPDDYKLPFIFGYFDGDGSFSKGNDNSYNISFVGNYRLLTSLVLTLNDKLNISICKLSKKSCSDKVFNISWRKSTDVELFCHGYIHLLDGKVSLDRKMVLIKEGYNFIILKNKIISNNMQCNENILAEIDRLNCNFKICSKCKKYIIFHSCYDKCNKCGRNSLRKVERPSKEELLKLITTKPLLQIGKDYGVSDNAIRKWCKYYGLPFKKNDIKEYIKNNNL